jgi:hypothetical protein
LARNHAWNFIVFHNETLPHAFKVHKASSGAGFVPPVRFTLENGRKRSKVALSESENGAKSPVKHGLGYT